MEGRGKERDVFCLILHPPWEGATSSISLRKRRYQQSLPDDASAGSKNEAVQKRSERCGG